MRFKLVPFTRQFQPTMFRLSDFSSASSTAASMSAVSLRASVNARFQKNKAKMAQNHIIKASIQDLTQHELRARLEDHMNRMEHWAKAEDVARTKKEGHLLAIKMIQDRLDPAYDVVVQTSDGKSLPQPPTHNNDVASSSSSDPSSMVSPGS